LFDQVNFPPDILMSMSSCVLIMALKVPECLCNPPLFFSLENLIILKSPQ
jgi:hypothetical protein